MRIRIQDPSMQGDQKFEDILGYRSNFKANWSP